MNVELVTPGWKLSAQTMRDLMNKITLGLTTRIINDRVMERSPALRRRFLAQVLEVIRDPNPDQTLEFTAAHPLPLFQSSFVGCELPPKKKWAQLESGCRYWPAEVQRHAKLLGIGSGKLPNWKKIERYFDSLGCSVVPVRGYIGSPVYFYLLANRIMPVCTNWVTRYEVQPYYYAPTDTMHDLGHGLAMAMPDYRELIIDYAHAVLRTGRYLSSKHLDLYTGRYFEFAYTYGEDKGVEPIGSAALVFETVRLTKTGLAPVVRETRDLRHQSLEFRPFVSRAAWQKETRAFIKSLKAKRHAIQN